MLKPLVPKFRPDSFARLKDIAKKLVHAKLKPIVGWPGLYTFLKRHGLTPDLMHFFNVHHDEHSENYIF